MDNVLEPATVPVTCDPAAVYRAAAERNVLRRAREAAIREARRLADLAVA